MSTVTLAGRSVNSTEGVVPPLSREWTFTAPSLERPLAGARAFALDGKGRRVHEVVGGELILPDPFAGMRGEAGAALYRTGDLVRWRSDGRLDFPGRAGHRVKLRGMRELGEIEAVLSRHSQVRDAVVLARPEEVRGLRLVAYVVPVGVAPGSYEFRENLKSILPEYRVPLAIVWLEVLPRTPNGKVDRRALAALEAPREERGERFAHPGTPLEASVAKIWSAGEVAPAPGPQVVDFSGERQVRGRASEARAGSRRVE